MAILLMLLLFLFGCGVSSTVTVAPPTDAVIEVTGTAVVVVPTAAVAVVCQATPEDGLGPYYIEGAPERSTLYPAGTAGTPLVISGTVYSSGCLPLAGAVVEVWQADSNGEYDFSDDFLGRATVIANENGFYEYTTVMPGEYEPRPLHIHYRVSHPTALTLVTQLYFADDNSGAPATQITTTSEVDGVLRGTFDVVLGG
jgi:protocatechuate 3,4-dioxygenase beta subunit